MLLLLSPAKTLDYDRAAPVEASGRPHFAGRAAELIDVLRQRSPAEIADLMHLSDKLTEVNVARYAAWRPRFTARNSKPALFAFNGDVYEGLGAGGLGAADIAWAQEHLAILSGLYGVLRPLDSLQPYRLEMGTRLATPRGEDLYAYWGDTIARYLNRRQAGEHEPIVVNLASEEYFKSVDRRALRARVVQCVFQEWKDGVWRIISFHAKRARGLMARHAILARASTPGALERFRLEGYAFDAAASEPDRLVFRRRSA
ncbi:MAG: peroxide stress protein YaaA [Methylibium sp.]|uniref:peroxide stress protein YaaA n=1 Tax=Methylibium sp. TaxID=2067992 RepID=UPI0017B3C27C|nr:peroxide stress protein YaaA [Methylibium sp.]MBA3598115.1 peroxide stress protein YaaA [Methylibium sp.]